MIVNHTLERVHSKDSTLLILGSFPSVKSRENNFYYMHPQNRFWKVLANVFNDDFTNPDILVKMELLKKHHISLYDVVEKCTINGSSDSSLKVIEYSDIAYFINSSKINKIILNGKLAYNLFIKRYPEYEKISYYLPSTSPANARFTLEKLIEEFEKIINL